MPILDETNTNHNQIIFGQTKLSKNEWEYIEVPIEEKEHIILDFIKKGFKDPSIVEEPYLYLLDYLKLSIQSGDKSSYIDYCIKEYLTDYITESLMLFDMYQFNMCSENHISHVVLDAIFPMFNINPSTFSLTSIAKKSNVIKKKDIIRINNTFCKSKKFINNDKIFEFVCLKQLINILSFIFEDISIAKQSMDKLTLSPSQVSTKYYKKTKTNYRTLEAFNSYVIDRLYALNKMIDGMIETNTIYENPILNFVKTIFVALVQNITTHLALETIDSWIENNAMLNKYNTLRLYDHQKQIFTLFNSPQKKPKFVYYCAPTGTGKTLTPIALATKFKIIFLCAARHIGLSFARNAISCGFKIALAFNCSDSEDIRLHYSSAKKFTKNYKSGGIYKVDNTVGDKVEIIISDLKSYPYACYYMSAFNDIKDVITFWDEPTISLDYNTHELHSIIHKNWNDNIIPNMVLSSATLPNHDMVLNVAKQFSDKFDTTIAYIKTHDYKKTISIYDTHSRISTPHLLLKENNASFEEFQRVVHSINNDNTLMRYLDIDSCVKFIIYIMKRLDIATPIIEDNKWYKLTPQLIKQLYLTTMLNIDMDLWKVVCNDNSIFHTTVDKKYDSTIRFMTQDAYTLTNGASIFLTNNIFKIATFCFQQMSISKDHLTYLYDVVDHNNRLSNKIKIIEKQIEDEESKLNLDTKERKICKTTEDNEASSKVRHLRDKCDVLYRMMKKTQLPNVYMPNSYDHIKKHHLSLPVPSDINTIPFQSSLSDDDVMKVLALPNILDSWKLLLMCGVGIVSDTLCNEYNILINEFAASQKLYMLIASSDYIYGTNYTFHHGYIGKDMQCCSRQKLIQAIGRIGRGVTNQHYSIRMRDDAIISMLFDDTTNNSIEAENMNRLFCYTNQNETFDDTGNMDNNNMEVVEQLEKAIDTAFKEGWVVEKIQPLLNTVIVCAEDNHVVVDDWETLVD